MDEQSWMGFEQRVQNRRFRALLDTMNRAISDGDAIEARVALEEARELRPGAPELAEIEHRLAAMPVLRPPVASRASLRSRAMSAVLLLLVGVGFLMGIDYFRAATSVETPKPAVASPELHIAAPILTPPPSTQPVTIVPPTHEIAEPERIGTSGLDRAIRSQPPVTVAQPTFRQASTVVPNGETPDDFVFQLEPSRQPAAAVSGPSGAVPSFTPVTAVAPAVPSAPVRKDPADRMRVAAALTQYARAYEQLDAGAAREVWPTVNERALARAFAGLASQTVAFDGCEIDVHGTTANASCRGRASYVGKIGSGERQIEARTWRFELRRDGEAWKIENAEARRQ